MRFSGLDKRGDELFLNDVNYNLINILTSFPLCLNVSGAYK